MSPHSSPNSSSPDPSILALSDYFSLLIVSIVWGSTNALLKRFASDASSPTTDQQVQNPSPSSFASDHRNSSTIFRKLFANLWNLIRNWKFSATFLVNQSGSILFYYLLSGLPITIVVPVVNALTFLFTALTGCLLGEEKPNGRTCLGGVLIVFGIGLCLID